MKWHHFGFYVSDLERSLAFYQKHFGFQKIQALTFRNEKIYFLEKGEVMIELIYRKGEVLRYSQNHICFKVDKLIIHGMSLLPIEGPILLDNGWKTAFFEGPDGEVIELIEQKGS
ncbi:VOC family protein [Thalassobacillus pellis]|uniref:VOC family protein n=1 Tax=Thalassobacillus pellis TaxID=748008 RepID=UPI001960A084|nr:VOC family protein [Thalassobacillus pellis]MBM7554221.1 lactoylglutathione lyase [Thalassobacillus pellis]